MWSSPRRGGAGLVAATAASAGLGIFLLLVGAGPPVRTAPTPRPVSGVAPLPPPTRTISVLVADLVVSLSVTPNRPGVNAFTVQVASARRPPPAPIDSMLLLVGTGASTVRLDRTSPEVYFGTGQLDRAGTVRLTAVIRRGGQRIEAPVAWSVDPATRPPAARAEAAQPAAAADSGPPWPSWHRRCWARSPSAYAGSCERDRGDPRDTP
jgi:copper transport protein